MGLLKGSGGSVTGTASSDNVGPLAGYSGGSISYAYSTENATAGVSGVAGGLVGYEAAGISYSYATGSVSGDAAGGLVGIVSGGSVSASYATGSVIGGVGGGGAYKSEGGLAGEAVSSPISNSYATGTVTDGSTYDNGFTGGLVGYLIGGFTVVSNSYSTGSVIGAGEVGGFAGYNYEGAFSGANYWDTTTSHTMNGYDNGNTANVTGETTSQMQNINTAGIYTGWDFTTTPIWVIPGPGQFPDLAFQYDVWKGGGGNNNWSNTANWSQSAVPTATSKVVFDEASTTNSTIDADGTVAELIIDGTNEGAYAGTITSSTGVVDNGAFVQDGGTFNASGETTSVTGLTTISGGTYTASSALQTLSGGLTVSGGTFTGSSGTVTTTNVILSNGTLTAPNSSGTFNVSGNWDITGGTFSNNSGTVTLNGSGAQGLTSDAQAFNNLTFSGSGTVTQNDGLTVNNNFIQSSGTFNSSHSLTFSVGGNFSIPATTGTLAFNRYTGSGTSGSYYVVYDVYGLQAMQEELAAYFKLNGTIAASSTTNWTHGFIPVGTGSGNAFSGTFNGQGNTITGLYINSSSLSYIGLFGYASSSASISNVGLVGGGVTGQNNVEMGGLVGENHGTISTVYNTGTVTATGNGDISGEDGGLVGLLAAGSISYSYSTGSVIGDQGAARSAVWWAARHGSGTSISYSYETGRRDRRWRHRSL